MIHRRDSEGWEVTRGDFLLALLGLKPKADDTPATVRLQSVYVRNLETAEVVERLNWPVKPLDAWGVEEQYISGPYRFTDIRVKIMEKL
jgi:hypothetical protein